MYAIGISFLKGVKYERGISRGKKFRPRCPAPQRRSFFSIPANYARFPGEDDPPLISRVSL